MRVLVADDHPVYLDGLVAAIDAAPDLDLVAVCADGEEALERLLALEPDVAALDHQMPTRSAIGVLEALAERGAPMRVLVFSGDLDGARIYEAIQAGASGYIPKSWPRQRICDAIRRVGEGHSIFAEDLHDSMGEEIRRRGAVARHRLTGREREILALLAEGGSAPGIAAELHLSVSTIKSHQHQLYEKLGVADRAAAVAEAMRRGLIR